MIKVTVPSQYIKPQLPDGQGGAVDNPMFAVALYANMRGIHPQVLNGHTVLDGITDIRDFPIRPTAGTLSIEEILGIGGEVDGYPVFFELTPTAYAGDVPAYMPDRSYIDDNDNEVIRTWAEYKDDAHEHTEINGKHYVASNPFGYDIPASAWIQADDETGITVKTVEEYKSILPSEEPA